MINNKIYDKQQETNMINNQKKYQETNVINNKQQQQI